MPGFKEVTSREPEVRLNDNILVSRLQIILFNFSHLHLCRNENEDHESGIQNVIFLQNLQFRS